MLGVLLVPPTATRRRRLLVGIGVVVGAGGTSVGCDQIVGLTGDYYVAIDSGEGPELEAGDEQSGEDAADAEDAGDDGEGEADAFDGGLTLPLGMLVFHRFTDYYAGDSQMYVVTSRAPPALPAMGPELGALYGLCNPLNGIFSPDGKKLALMAQPMQPATPCPATDRNQMDVYLLDLQRPGEKQQVTANAVPDEDPQYAPSGAFLVFKHNGHLAEWPVGPTQFTDCGTLPPLAYCFNASGAEQSKPVVTPDEKTICYYESQGPGAAVYCFDRAAGHNGADISQIAVPVAAEQSILNARPMVDPSSKSIYYIRWRAQNNPVTIIDRKPLSDFTAPPATGAFCSDPAGNYAEPCALGAAGGDGGNTLVISSDFTGQGSYDLFLVDFTQTPAVSLDHWLLGINTPKQEVGASFWRQP
jgi:hypothetical protein